MTAPRLLPSFAWVFTLLMALGFVVGANLNRIKQVERLTYSTMATPAIDSQSPTGYAGGLRMLIAPGRNNESYQWIAQTQQMLATREWRVRQVNYDNAPGGRPVSTPSLYRWWLALVAWGDHELSGRPIALSVEKAALWADPLLLILLLVGGTFLARQFSPLSAVFFPLGIATLYPLGTAFLPGCPDDPALALVLMAGCLMTLLAGILPSARGVTRPGGWFIASGILGGVGMWLSVISLTPVLVSVMLGALAGIWLTRRNPTVARLPWRTWGIAGAITTILAWLFEYAPAHLGLAEWRLTEVHPLYAIAWLGGGELLARSTGWIRGNPTARRRTDSICSLLAGFAVLALPLALLLKGTPGFLAADVFSFRLAALGEATTADNLAKWIVSESFSPRLLGVVAPLLLLIPALAALLRRDTDARQRLAILLVLVPAVIALIFACGRINWWNHFDLLAVVLVLAALPGSSLPEVARRNRWLLPALASGVILPGLFLLWPSATVPSAEEAKQELEALAEREFSHWLAKRSGPEKPIVLAPPDLTVSLFYHGGLRGLGSPYGENENGFRASVRLAGAAHADEAQALARQRGVTHFVLPSWDNFLDEYARLGGNPVERTFIGLLHSWLPPRWLRPVPYYLPKIDQFANERLVIFEATDVQDNATALSRLTEYFVDMGQLEIAAQAAHALGQDHGADLGAQVAKARTEIVRRDRAGFEKSLQAIAVALKEGADDVLAWDRRVSLCLVLATADLRPQAEAQTRRCLDDMNEADLRTLSEVTLFQFLSLTRKLGLQIQDTQLRELATSLLPTALQAQL